VPLFEVRQDALTAIAADRHLGSHVAGGTVITADGFRSRTTVRFFTLCSATKAHRPTRDFGQASGLLTDLFSRRFLNRADLSSRSCTSAPTIRRNASSVVAALTGRKMRIGLTDTSG